MSTNSLLRRMSGTLPSALFHFGAGTLHHPVAVLASVVSQRPRYLAADAKQGAEGEASSAKVLDQEASLTEDDGSKRSDAGESSGNGEGLTAKELMERLKEREEKAEKLTQEVAILTDGLKRTLADMENLRSRTAREVDNVKKFAIQNFVKSLLDVPDNLERAAAAVPSDAVNDGSAVTPEKLRNLLQGLLHGVNATEAIMLKVLKQHGIERYDPTGDHFDPNLHNALFDVPDPSKQNNTVAVVTKRGYKLNDRVIRPAEVGVVKNPSP